MSADKMVLNKVDSQNGNAYVAGAKFRLYRVEPTGTPEFRQETLQNPDKTLDQVPLTPLNGDAMTGYWLADIETTGSSMIIENQYLMAGKLYCLVEYDAPAGHQIIGDGRTWFYYHERPENAIDGIEVASANMVTVDNPSFGYELPETGGAGTAANTLCGVGLLAGAALWLERRRRRA